MAHFPEAEADVAALVTAMSAGYAAHAADFPSADAVALGAAQVAYLAAKTAQTDALAAARVATETKNVALAALEALMHTELKKSEVDVVSDPEKLEYIGWGPRIAPSPTPPPGQPRDLDPIVQGPGTLLLKWRSAPGSIGGTARTYLIERREEPAGGGEFGDWAQASMAIDTEAILTSQPRGPQMEYRIKGVNVGGESVPSNTVAVVL